MLFSDLELSKRLERAEGHACLQFAAARRRLFPNSGAEWMEHAGACVAFDGEDSPITQTFGLGLFEELNPASLNTIERFFLDRAAPVLHEVSPLVGTAALDLLCSRHYRPIEISSVMYRAVENDNPAVDPHIAVRVTTRDEAQLWASVNAEAWTYEHPEMRDTLLEMSVVSSSRGDSPCFLAELEGQPAAAASLWIHDGVALFAGAATLPGMRRRGLQAALLEERMHYAFDHGCDLAMMVAEAGSNSQRNAERRGYRVAYTRMKWRLFA